MPPKPPKLPPKAPKVAPKPPKVPLRRNIDKVQVVKSLNLTSSDEQPPKVPRRRDANQVQVVKSLNLTSSDEQPPEVPRRKNVNQVQVVKSLNLTSSDGPSKETSATLNQQIKITHLQQENARLQQEVSRLQQDNALLQQKTNQLQSKLEQQPGLGCDADISFWVVSHKEVQITDQELGRGAWGRVLIGSFRGQDVAIKELHDLISSSDYYKDIFTVVNISPFALKASSFSALTCFIHHSSSTQGKLISPLSIGRHVLSWIHRMVSHSPLDTATTMAQAYAQQDLVHHYDSL